MCYFGGMGLRPPAAPPQHGAIAGPQRAATSTGKTVVLRARFGRPVGPCLQDCRSPGLWGLKRGALRYRMEKSGITKEWPYLSGVPGPPS